jgi:hypothetical protein
MKHGDKLKLQINNSLVTGVFQAWESSDTIAFLLGSEAYVTHYKSVVEINGRGYE